MYREESDRQQWLSTALPADLGEFYRSLKMTVTIEPPDGYAVPRFAQLTQRTNQFNFTTRRYSEGEIRAKLADPSHGRIRHQFGGSVWPAWRGWRRTW